MAHPQTHLTRSKERVCISTHWIVYWEGCVCVCVCVCMCHEVDEGVAGDEGEGEGAKKVEDC